MYCKKETKSILKYTNEDGTQTFDEGDAVICFTEKGRYTGIIAAIDIHQENEHSQYEDVVYIDIVKDDMKHFRETIRLADIEYICRIPSNCMFGYPDVNETLDRRIFIEKLVGLGYDKAKAEILYDNVKIFITLYNIPITYALLCAIQKVHFGDGKEKNEELIEIANGMINAMADRFQSVTELIREKRISLND